MEPLDLPLSGRKPTYLLLVGSIMAMLTVGLMLPIAFGERARDRLEASGSRAEDLDLRGFESGGSESSDSTVSDDGATQAGGPTAQPGSEPGTDPSGAPSAGSARDESGGLGLGTPTPAAGAGSSPVAAGGATDVGVTADTIKIGVLLPTSETVGDPSAQSSAQLEYFQAYADEINEAGGIHGRRIEYVVASYDLLDQEEGARAACLRLARDEKVFAAVNSTGYGPPGALCLTREHGVPFLQGSGHPAEVYAQAGGLYSSNFDSQTRNLANMVAVLDQLGVLRGKKIGMLGTEWIGLRREQDEGIVDTLKLLGYDPFVYYLSGDPVSSQSQIPVAVQQMQTNGVEVVIFGADFISGTSFVQQAESQLFAPSYAAADPWGWSTDFVVSGMPDSFVGAITVTAMRTYDARAGLPEAPTDAACREIYERRTGNDLDYANDDSALYVGSMWACGVLQRIKLAGDAVGPDLTRAAFARALGELGTIPVPYSGGPGTFVGGKLDGANQYRPQVFERECRCWVPLTPNFQEGRYDASRWR